MRLRERLERESSHEVAFLTEVYAAHAHELPFVGEAITALAGDGEAQIGATWLMKRYLEEGERLTARDNQRFIAAGVRVEPWEARLHVLQCLPFLVIPAKSRGVLEPFVRAALVSDAKFVRAWAFSGLHALASAFEELQPEAEELFERGMGEGPASVRARIRNLRKQGF